jgi:chromate reductase
MTACLSTMRMPRQRAFQPTSPISPMRSARRMRSSLSHRNITGPSRAPSRMLWTGIAAGQPATQGQARTIQSATGGPLGGARMQYHLRMALTFLCASVFGTPEVLVGLAQTKFDPGTLELKDEPTRKAVADQLAAFAKFAARHKA